MNKLLLAAAVLVIFLLACSAPQPGGSAITGAEFDRAGQELRITVHVYQTEADLVAARKKRVAARELKGRLRGWAEWSPNDVRCDIHVLPIGTNESMTTAGHELAHCLYGGFHD